MTPSPYGALSDELEGLIERVGKATGPDREIDLDLAAFGFITEAFAEQGLRFDPNAVDRGPKFFHDPGMCGGMGFNWAAPPYTASIDATIAFCERILPGYRWGVSCAPIKDGDYPDGKTKYADGFKAHLTKSSPLRPMPIIGEARTPALAILLAALRSLQTGDAK